MRHRTRHLQHLPVCGSGRVSFRRLFRPAPSASRTRCHGMNGLSATAGCGVLTHRTCCFGAHPALTVRGGRPCSQTARVSQSGVLFGVSCNARPVDGVLSTVLRVLPLALATSLAMPDAAMGSLMTYAYVRMLSDVDVPPTVRAGSVHELHPELKSPVRVELEVHRQPRCEAATSPLDTAGAATAPSFRW
jgi:hypothetical protein